MMELIKNNSHTVSLNFHRTLAIDKIDFIVMAVISSISSTFNAISIYLILRKKKIRPVDYLIGNLCFCTFFMSFTLLGMFSMTHFFMMTFYQQWMCSLINYTKYFPGALITLSSFGISFERIRSLTLSGRTVSGSTSIKMILQVWILAGIITFPEMLRSTTISDPETATSTSTLCTRVPLLNSKFSDVFYELLKFFFLHILFSICLLYELYVIRSKIKYLGVYSVPGPRLQKKVSRVRFAFIYSIILITVWVSTGTVHLLYKIPIWFTPKSLPAKSSSSKTFNFLMATSCLYLLINPIVVFLSNQDIKIFRKLLCRYCFKSTPPAGIDANIKHGAAETLDQTDLDISRFATQQATCSRSHENEKDEHAEDKLKNPISNGVTNNDMDGIDLCSTTQVSIHDEPDLKGMSLSTNEVTCMKLYDTLSIKD